MDDIYCRLKTSTVISGVLQYDHNLLKYISAGVGGAFLLLNTCTSYSASTDDRNESGYESIHANEFNLLA